MYYNMGIIFFDMGIEVKSKEIFNHYLIHCQLFSSVSPRNLKVEIRLSKNLEGHTFVS